MENTFKPIPPSSGGMLSRIKEIIGILAGKPSGRDGYKAKKGNYVLHKVAEDGSYAIYRHPNKSGPGRQMIVKKGE